MDYRARVTISGLPGKMAKIIAEGIRNERNDLWIHSHSLTGKGQPKTFNFKDSTIPFGDITLVEPEKHEEFLKELILTGEGILPLYAIDFCKGEGVALRNAELYCSRSIPFVMGSTIMGAPANEIYSSIKNLAEQTRTPCVVAPNFDQQIVAWMSAWDYMGRTYPGTFAGSGVTLKETHQADKIKKDGTAETSGTARAMVRGSNLLLGTNQITEDQIICVRDPKSQMDHFDVPKEWLGWHAYHFLTLSREHDGVYDSESLIFKRHGGDSYRRGAMKALDFLLSIRGKEKKYYHTMEDVMNPKYLLD